MPADNPLPTISSRVSSAPQSTLNRELIAATVAKLLTHYWISDMSPGVRAAQGKDWGDDLGEFPAALVADACTEWRRTQPDRRPTPGHIRKLCIEMRPAPRAAGLLADHRSGDAIEGERVRRAAQFQAAAEHREQWARDHGCKDFAEAMLIGLRIVGDRALHQAAPPSEPDFDIAEGL